MSEEVVVPNIPETIVQDPNCLYLDLDSGWLAALYDVEEVTQADIDSVNQVFLGYLSVSPGHVTVNLKRDVFYELGIFDPEDSKRETVITRLSPHLPDPVDALKVLRLISRTGLDIKKIINSRPIILVNGSEILTRNLDFAVSKAASEGKSVTTLIEEQPDLLVSVAIANAVLELQPGSRLIHNIGRTASSTAKSERNKKLTDPKLREYLSLPEIKDRKELLESLGIDPKKVAHRRGNTFSLPSVEKIRSSVSILKSRGVDEKDLAYFFDDFRGIPADEKLEEGIKGIKEVCTKYNLDFQKLKKEVWFRQFSVYGELSAFKIDKWYNGLIENGYDKELVEYLLQNGILTIASSMDSIELLLNSIKLATKKGGNIISYLQSTKNCSKAAIITALRELTILKKPFDVTELKLAIDALYRKGLTTEDMIAELEVKKEEYLTDPLLATVYSNYLMHLKVRNKKFIRCAVQLTPDTI